MSVYLCKWAQGRLSAPKLKDRMHRFVQTDRERGVMPHPTIFHLSRYGGFYTKDWYQMHVNMWVQNFLTLCGLFVAETTMIIIYHRRGSSILWLANTLQNSRNHSVRMPSERVVFGGVCIRPPKVNNYSMRVTFSAESIQVVFNMLYH